MHPDEYQNMIDHEEEMERLRSMSKLNKKHSTSFTVYPDMCNYMEVEGKPMVHGGYMLMKMDRVAAECCRRFLYDAEPVMSHKEECGNHYIGESVKRPVYYEVANTALTVNVTDVTFFVGATLGDIIFLKAEVVKTGNKRIHIQVTGEREDNKGNREKICEGEFVFCAMHNNEKSVPHGLKV